MLITKKKNKETLKTNYKIEKKNNDKKDKGKKRKNLKTIKNLTKKHSDDIQYLKLKSPFGGQWTTQN